MIDKALFLVYNIIVVMSEDITGYMQTYRSGHNGADSKSVGRGNLARGFKSRRLRACKKSSQHCSATLGGFHFSIKYLLPSNICLPHLSRLEAV